LSISRPEKCDTRPRKAKQCRSGRKRDYTISESRGQYTQVGTVLQWEKTTDTRIKMDGQWVKRKLEVIVPGGSPGEKGNGGARG